MIFSGEKFCLGICNKHRLFLERWKGGIILFILERILEKLPILSKSERHFKILGKCNGLIKNNILHESKQNFFLVLEAPS